MLASSYFANLIKPQTQPVGITPIQIVPHEELLPHKSQSILIQSDGGVVRHFRFQRNRRTAHVPHPPNGQRSQRRSDARSTPVGLHGQHPHVSRQGRFLTLRAVLPDTADGSGLRHVGDSVPIARVDLAHHAPHRLATPLGHGQDAKLRESHEEVPVREDGVRFAQVRTDEPHHRLELGFVLVVDELYARNRDVIIIIVGAAFVSAASGDFESGENLGGRRRG
mmetsp:Transcript_30760/g.89825  ORF Transcript_30760/g.89825 Transcript_30760/m.89825 type:complete len:223 (+) Transcript_30760:77-745(+)